jgi:tubulin---tyrosine ligase
METDSNTFNKDLSPILEFNKDTEPILRVKSLKPKLPEKDKKFLEELHKRNSENSQKHNVLPVPIFPNDKKKNRGVSLTKQNSRKEKQILNHTASMNFKDGLNINKHKSLISPDREGQDSTYKYFIGPGNNDSLVKRIIGAWSGWEKAPTAYLANLIWTEVKQGAIFDLIPSLSYQKHKKIVLSESNKIPSVPLIENESYKLKIYNKLEGNKELASKKRLFINLYSYYKGIGENPFKYIPLTFHMTKGTADPSFNKFIKKFKRIQKEIPKDKYLNNCWIVKPGESTNRGIGITVCSTIDEVSKCVEESKITGSQRTYIVQKYIYKPMLYLNRKFDIRCYLLVTIINSNFQAYFYKDGYLRTSCQEFDMNRIHDKFIHLTNDAVQKNSPDYGKFEDGNKLSYDEFQEYINDCAENKIDFKQAVYPKMKKIVIDTIKSTYKKLDPRKRMNSFEIFGYDFMLDEMYNPWLLEINTNPCLALSGHYLALLIPLMLNHSFDIVLNQLLPGIYTEKKPNNQYELVFSQKII